jgi:hypothetical protein
MDRLSFWTVRSPETQAMNLLWRNIRTIGPIRWTYMTIEGYWASHRELMA